MSIIKQDFGGLNENITKTLLWTNPNSTSSFAGGNITLSESRNNFDYLIVKWKMQLTDTNLCLLLIPMSEYGVNLYQMFAMSYYDNQTTATIFRQFHYNSNITDNQIRCSAGNPNNDICVPIEVYGIKGLEL